MAIYTFEGKTGRYEIDTATLKTWPPLWPGDSVLHIDGDGQHYIEKRPAVGLPTLRPVTPRKAAAWLRKRSYNPGGRGRRRRRNRQ